MSNMVRSLILTCAALSAACKPTTGQAPQAASIPRDQFAQLSFLEGDWRGTMPDGKPFFERYRVTSDSTIQMYGFPDSTMTAPGDSSRIYWRDNHIYSQGGGTRYVVASIDDNGVRFVPEQGRNEFTWKQTAEGWMATLNWKDKSGEARSVVYEMRKLN